MYPFIHTQCPHLLAEGYIKVVFHGHGLLTTAPTWSVEVQLHCTQFNDHCVLCAPDSAYFIVNQMKCP